MDCPEGSNELSPAEQALHQVERVSRTVCQISSQLTELHDCRKSLARIEKALAVLMKPSRPVSPDEDLWSSSVDVRKFKHPQESLEDAAMSQGLDNIPPPRDLSSRRASETPGNSQNPSLYRMLDVLEEHTVCVLQKPFRKHNSDASRGDEVHHAHSSAHSSGPSSAQQSREAAAFSCAPVPEEAKPAKPSSVLPLPPTDRLPTVAQEGRLPLQNGAMIQLRRRDSISLDKLRANYDAVITTTTMKPAAQCDCPKTDQDCRHERACAIMQTLQCDQGSALPWAGWFLLCCVGILDFYKGRAWHILGRLILFVQLAVLVFAGFALSSWQKTAAEVEPLISTLLYLLGVLVATLSLRRSKITSVLGPTETPLDDYAAACEFHGDWKTQSGIRLLQIGAYFVLMMCCRAAAMLWTGEAAFGKYTGCSLQDSTGTVAYVVMAGCYCTACYCALHITAGLELAIDSFAVRCFRTADMEASVAEWNVVQATLRQTSGQLSEFVVVLASSCIGAAILLAHQVISFSGSEVAVRDVALLLGWLYPPILLFLYTISMAAAVTEKVDRLAPLVNSWLYDGQDVLDDSRQYVVQYILNSRAGFYIKGVRITAFSVQKLSYYFPAGSFGLLANLWQ